MPSPSPDTGRHRRLADGTTSRGYIAVEVELLDAPISGEALALLLRLRQDTDQRERDGFVEARALDALAAYWKVPERKMQALLAELEAAEVIRRPAEGIYDLNFLAHSKSHADREREREQWRQRQERTRQARMSRRDTHRDSPRDAQRESRQQSPLESRNTKERPKEKEEVPTVATLPPVPPGADEDSERPEGSARGGPLEGPPFHPERLLPTGVAARARLLHQGCEEVLQRPLHPVEEWPLPLAWAELKRGEDYVPVQEVLDCVRYKMAQPTRDGLLAGSLKWSASSVDALRRQPFSPSSPRAAPADRRRSPLHDRNAAVDARVYELMGQDPGAGPPDVRVLPGGVS